MSGIKKTVYLDLDGVVANWLGGFLKLKGACLFSDSRELWHNFSVVTQGGIGFCRNIEPFHHSREFYYLIKELSHRAGYTVEVLTGIPKLINIPTVRDEKIAWVHEHLDENLIVNFGPLSEDKQNWANPQSILIDDSYLNISQWITRGGYAIHHESHIKTLYELQLRLGI